MLVDLLVLLGVGGLLILGALGLLLAARYVDSLFNSLDITHKTKKKK